MRLPARLWIGVLASLVPAAAGAGAKLTCELRENEMKGRPLGSIQLEAEGASPGVSKDGGDLTFEFPRLTPGDVTTVRLSHDGWAIVSNLDPREIRGVTLLKDPSAARLVIIISKDTERTEWRGRYVRASMGETIDADHDRLVAELQKANAANAEALEQALERLRLQREEARAQADVMAQQIAELRRSTPELEAAWQRAVDEKDGSALGSVARLLDRDDRNAARISHRFATRTLGARRWLPTLMPSISWIEGGMRPGVSASAETLAPVDGFLSRASATLELGWVQWDEEPSFVALPGTRAIQYGRYNSFAIANGGLRYYFLVKGAARLYAGGSMGVLAQPDYGWSRRGYAFHGAAGVFLYPRSWRVGLELRASELQTRSQERVFDPYGTTQPDERQRFRPAVTLGVQVVPMW